MEENPLSGGNRGTYLIMGGIEGTYFIMVEGKLVSGELTKSIYHILATSCKAEADEVNIPHPCPLIRVESVVEYPLLSPPL